MAGRVQYVTVKSVGTHRRWRKPVARLESGKWAGGIPAPFDGVIVEVNPKVVGNPNLINIAPYTEAWLVRMRPDEPANALAHLAIGADARRS